ncbi:MAG: YceI family protein [Deltaproteobacteria bacterium]|nr:YceI family protein [Deltaproteobacteria bacterium]
MEKVNGFKEISPDQLFTWMEARKDFHLIDTLTKIHYQKRHLPNAKNACVFEVSFMEQIAGITTDKHAEIILYGSSIRSMDAQTAAEKLARSGYRHVSVLKGGIEDWQTSGRHLEGVLPDEPDTPGTLLELADRTYHVDTDQSIIEWTGRNAGNRHFGTIAIQSGTVAVKDGTVSGAFDIDMKSIKNTNLEGNELQPVLIAHLNSDDFFFTQVFPSARFSFSGAKITEEPFLTSPNCQIHGTLELRGIKVDQRFQATVTRTADNGLAAEAHFDIDRTNWHIIYGSTRFFEHLGMHMVFDPVSIQVRIVAV